ncbi:hypothetical protein GG344DRAFT_81352 [Lentinula edodes]|nr:hypothetical protein GG344DRAFT_81352 [Lentinula edodes]
MSSSTLHDALLVAETNAVAPEFGDMNLEAVMPGAFICPASQPVVICLSASTILPEPTVSHVAHTPIPDFVNQNSHIMELTIPHVAHDPISESGNQNSSVVMPGYFTTSNARSVPISPTDMTVFELSLLAQRDQRSKEKVLLILAKAFLDLNSIGSEEKRTNANVAVATFLPIAHSRNGVITGIASLVEVEQRKLSSQFLVAEIILNEPDLPFAGVHHRVNIEPSLICHYWREPAFFARFRTVDVDDEVQLALLRNDSRRLRYVRNAIGDPQSAFTNAFTSYPIHLRSLEIRGTDFNATKERINEAIIAFSGTITTFIIHNSLRMSYQDYCGILKSLAHCKVLRTLTLPLPTRELDDHSSSQQRANSAHAAIRAMTHGEEEKAKLVSLQLVPSSYRHDPLYTGKAPHAQEYGWLDGRKCPFDLSELKTLVVGAASAAQILLPSISEHLTRLEFCLPFDNRSAWTEYGNVCFPGINLSVLTIISRKSSRSSDDSTCLAVSWSDLSYTPVELVTGCHSNTSNKEHLH